MEVFGKDDRMHGLKPTLSIVRVVAGDVERQTRFVPPPPRPTARRRSQAEHITVKCARPDCTVIFTTKRKGHKYHSLICAHREHLRRKHRDRLQLAPIACGNPACQQIFTPRRRNEHCCSSRCGGKYQHWLLRQATLAKLTERACQGCGLRFTPQRPDGRFHSKACYQRWWKREWSRKRREDVEVFWRGLSMDEKREVMAARAARA